MPAQKRSFSDTTNDDEESLQQHISNSKQSRREQQLQQQQQYEAEHDEQSQPSDDDEGDREDEEKDQLDEDGDGSPSSSSEEKKTEKSEYVFVKLSDIRKDVQCPICLGIIKKTRTVMECLHRFCRECIDKSMRLGNNECPACRTHCASRRSLRDDPNFDALIAALYPDIAKYEEEELAFHEEEKTRNKQIQASIAQVLQKQSEALVKRRSLGRDPGGGFLTRSQRLRTTHPRRRRNSRGSEHACEENEDEHDGNGGKDSSSADEHTTEVRQRGRRKRTGIRSSVPSSSVDGQCVENDLEPGKEGRGISPGLVWNPEMLAWGRGGTRSHTRHGANNGHSKNSKSTRLSKLVEYLRSLEEISELDVFFTLVSLDKERIADLKQPYLCSGSRVTIRHLCDYVAQQTPLQTEEVEILLIKGKNNNENISTLTLPLLDIKNHNALPGVDPQACEFEPLKRDKNLGVIVENHTSTRNHLILGYRQKKTEDC